MLSHFDQLLCKAAAAHAAACRDIFEDASSRCSSVFVVSKVINDSGGRTGCFLYRGQLVAPTLPRSHTPDCSNESASGSNLDSQLLGAGDAHSHDSDSEGQPNWAELEGQELTLYMSYEEASPKMKQRAGTAGGAAAAARSALAPWRVSLRDASDDMLFCLRGLPPRLQLDEEAGLMTWGPSVAVAFPTPEDACTFARGMVMVGIERRCLAGSPQAALLQVHAAEQRLSSATPGPAALLKPAAAVAATPAPAAPAAPTLIPPSPDLLAAVPRVGCKRPADSALPPPLITPNVKPRIISSAAMITPNCTAELLA